MKIPPKLPSNYQKIYKQFYLDYAGSKTFFRKLSAILESWYHKKIAHAHYPLANILEVGAGSLNHLCYELDQFTSYDVVEPKSYLIDNSPFEVRKRVNNIFTTVDHIPHATCYDTIISIATLEHIWDLDSHLFKLSQKLSSKGEFLVAIPAEGEFLWWIAWRLTTGIGFWIKYRLDYGVIMRYEHVNDAASILDKISKYFKIQSIESFPFSFKHFRLFILIKAAKVTD